MIDKSDAQFDAGDREQLLRQLADFQQRLADAGLTVDIDSDAPPAVRLAALQDAALNGLAHSRQAAIDQRIDDRLLCERERRLTDILESIPDAFVSFDRNLHFTYLNGNAERLQEVTREAVLGKDVRDVYPDPESYKTISLYEQVLREQQPVTAVSYHAGFSRWVEVCAFPTPDGVSVFYRDVSAQIQAGQERERLLNEVARRAEDAEESRRLLQALMEYVPEGITIADAPDITLRMVSRYGTALLGSEHTEKTAAEVANAWTVYYPDGETVMPADELPLVRAIDHVVEQVAEEQPLGDLPRAAARSRRIGSRFLLPADLENTSGAAAGIERHTLRALEGAGQRRHVVNHHRPHAGKVKAAQKRARS